MKIEDNLQEFNHEQVAYLIDMDLSRSLFLEYQKTLK